MKKLALALLSASLITASSQAAFYTGIQMGPSFNTSSLTATLNGSDFFTQKAGSGAAFLGGGFVGYDHVMDDNNMYFALEGHVSYHGLKNNCLTITNLFIPARPQIKLTLKNTMLYGLALQVGTQLENQVTPFVSLGFTAGKYKLSADTDNTNIESVSKNIFGFTPGLGVKYNYGEMVVSTKYQYFMGGKISKNYLAQNISVSNKIREHIVTLGLAWSF